VLEALVVRYGDDVNMRGARALDDLGGAASLAVYVEIDLEPAVPRRPVGR
jgi:hypothetical protein